MKGIESRLKNQPKYKIGQAVKVQAQARHVDSGTIFNVDVEAFISTIEASFINEAEIYIYGITTDMPAPYHVGKRPFAYIHEEDIVLAC